jgi:galacturonokinase
MKFFQRISVFHLFAGCEPLVQLHEILVQAPGVFGARFSGAGFRGCCVALVAAAHAEEAAKYVQEYYKKAQPDLAKQLNNATAVFICDSADRAHVRWSPLIKSALLKMGHQFGCVLSATSLYKT